MKLIAFDPDRDFDNIKNWIPDERDHAMWCANLFAYPLQKENFINTLAGFAEKWGDTQFLAVTDEEEAAGFFSYAHNHETNEVMLKFVVVNPEFRGKGIAGEMLRLVSEYAFDNGAGAVQLNVFPENERAKKCYLKAGFTERSITEKAFTYKDEAWGRCNMVLRKQD